MDLSAGAAIREDALSASCACCQSTAAAASRAAALPFVRLVTFRTGIINLELATTTITATATINTATTVSIYCMYSSIYAVSGPGKRPI